MRKFIALVYPYQSGIDSGFHVSPQRASQLRQFVTFPLFGIAGIITLHPFSPIFLLIRVSVSLKSEVASIAENAYTTVDVIYREHHGWLCAWLRRKLNCPHQAADIAHDTFLRVLALSQMLDLQEPRAYLTTTAKRLIIDQARRQRVEQAYLAELALAAEALDHVPSPEQILATIQVLERISAALEGLAQKPQQAFLLHYLEGQTHAEIANHLGVSDRMVRKYLVQALMYCCQFRILD